MLALNCHVTIGLLLTLIVSINNVLNAFDWHSLFGFNFDAESMWSGFKNVIWPVISAYVPQKNIPHYRKYKPHHYPKNIRKLLSRKSAIWRQLKMSKSSALYCKYYSVANECKLAIFQYDAQREERLLNANNLGAFYKFVNNKTGSHSSIPPLKNNLNSFLFSDEDKANLLNKYFESVFTKDDGIVPPFPSRIPPNNPGISDVTITPHIINKILIKLKTNSAAGPDCLPPIFFHHAAASMQYPLSILFRSLIDLHSLPSEWKTSVITPKFKKGSPSDPANYRPIALTCTCCKILESLISSELNQYLLEHKLITPHQHGFLKRHSTSTNLLESINDWSISISNRKSVNIAYIDYKSAFDCISHRKLMIKLFSYGISGNLYLWIEAFLTNRSQSVKINSFLSTPCPVSSGVPQGSVLGPLLFCCFINDVTDQLDPTASTKLFADDIKLYTSFSNIAPSILQSQLDIIQSWSSLWQLRISHSKCNILTIGPHQQPTNFVIDNIHIAQADHVCDLGVTIDSQLKFRKHISNIVSKANQRKSLILRSFLSRNPANLIRAFKVYIRPLLEYASTTWSPSFITDILLLESVQRDFTKRVPGCSHLSYTERLSFLKLPTLEHRRLMADLIMVYNILTHNTFINNSPFTLNPNNHLRGHPLKLSVPITKTNTHKSIFFNRIIPIWNSLPADIVLSNNTTSFRYKLKAIDLNRHLVFPSIIFD